MALWAFVMPLRGRVRERRGARLYNVLYRRTARKNKGCATILRPESGPTPGAAERGRFI